MHGCNGKMGQVISNLTAADSDIEIVAGIDPHDDGHNAYPVYRSIFECGIDADVIIDFAAAGAVNNLLDYAVNMIKHIIYLTVTHQFSAYGFSDKFIIIFHYIGLYRHTVKRRLVEYRQISDSA